jgi:L-asparaginase II
MVAGTDRFCTRLNGKLGGTIQAKGGAEGVYCCMLPTLGLGLALKIWDGAGRASEVATATILERLGLLPASERDAIVHPPIKSVVGLLVGEMRPAKTWLG